MKYNAKKQGRPKGTTKVRKPISKDIFNTLYVRLETSSYDYDKKMIALGAFILLRYGGFRVSELIHLRVQDLFDMYHEHTMHLTNKTKTKKPREVYFDKNIAIRIFNLFSNFVDMSDMRAVLFRGRGGRYDKRNPTSFTYILNEILHEMLGAQYSTHSFRAGHITDMHYEGISIKVIQEHIGHISQATTLRYVGVEEKQKRAAVSVL